MKNDLLAAAFGWDRVLGALANMSGEVLPSGEVLFTRNVNVLIGDLAGGVSNATQKIAQTIDASGVRATAVPDISSQEWSKFAGWVGLVGVSITAARSTWKFLIDRGGATGAGAAGARGSRACSCVWGGADGSLDVSGCDVEQWD